MKWKWFFFVNLTAIRSSAIALPLEWNKVGQIVVETHAVAGRVAPVVHLATPRMNRIIGDGCS